MDVVIKQEKIIRWTRLLFFFSIISLLLLSTPSFVLATLDSTIDYDQVVVNSNDWKDVYLGLLYAQVTNTPGDYILSAEIVPDVIASLPKNKETVLLIETSGKEIIKGVKRQLEDRDFTVEELSSSKPTGLRLLQTITPKKIILLDERYPYNSISVAPYVIREDAFVLFADATTIDEVENIIADLQVPVIIYGYADAVVLERLQPYIEEIIDTGDKYENNIFLVNKMLTEADEKQVIVSDGEYFETSMIDDFNPVLFIGASNTPQQVVDYLLDSPITHAVVVGPEMANTASALKNRLQTQYKRNISFMMMFAKTPRIQVDQFSLPSALEILFLPVNTPSLFIASITYNRLSLQLEVTYENPSSLKVFFLSTITLQSNEELVVIGDDDTQSILSGQQKTMLYDVTLENVGSLSGDIISLFGESPRSLAYKLTDAFPDISIISLQDLSELEILDAEYDKSNDAFFIRLQNPGKVTTYTSLSLIDVIINGNVLSLGGDKIYELAAGEELTVFVRAELSELDLLEMPELHVLANYGQRKEVLFKVKEKILVYTIKWFSPLYLLAIVALLFLILITFLLFNRKNEYVCDRCNHHVVAKKKPGRHSCGGRFKKN